MTQDGPKPEDPWEKDGRGWRRVTGGEGSVGAKYGGREDTPEVDRGRWTFPYCGVRFSRWKNAGDTGAGSQGDVCLP